MRLIKELYGKRHFSDCTVAQSIVNPLYATLETAVVGMSDLTSLKTRGINTLLTYVALGHLAKFRNWSKRKIGITKESSGKVKFLYDSGFVATLIVGIKPLTYLAAGETDWKKIALATGISTLMGGALGGPIFYCADVFRELVGIEDSERTPRVLYNKSRKFKRNLAIALVASSLAATGLVYTLTPNKKADVDYKKLSLERVVEVK